MPGVSATGQEETHATWFQRFLLPGFAFKAVIIGGGYATGRELAEFFLPSGPWGGVAAMLLATLAWSIVAALTFAFAQRFRTFDYRHFVGELLGPAWILFEAAYVFFVVLILAVFGAAAGEIGAALFDAPPVAGTLLLAVAIGTFATLGNASVEALFKYVSFLLYGVYALFLILALTSFGDRIAAAFATSHDWGAWVPSGLTYATYNLVGAIVILPVIRHLGSRKEALIAGAIAGPLAMLPALLFFLAMAAFIPAIGNEALPSDYLLLQMHAPLFHLLFQVMIFAALLESGTGAVHAINERIAAAWNTRREQAYGRRERAIVSALLLAICMFAAQRIGLVELIAKGYRLLAAIFLFVFVLPLLTVGSYRLFRSPAASAT
jgi:uncharacterized membrane protein YkvI